MFEYNIDNAEVFSQQVQAIEDRSTLNELKKVLESAKELYNMLRAQAHSGAMPALDFKKLNIHLNTVSQHLTYLSDMHKLTSGGHEGQIVNLALEDMYFQFRKIDEAELKMADELKDVLYKTRKAMQANLDVQDPEYLSLLEALEALLQSKAMGEVTCRVDHQLKQSETIEPTIRELNRKNENLRMKYQGDAKYMRTHKRVQESKLLSLADHQLYDALLGIKRRDAIVLKNNQVVNNEKYFKSSMNPILVKILKEHQVTANRKIVDLINHNVTKEYLEEYNNGDRPW